MSEQLNPGDVTGPRWAGGAINPPSFRLTRAQAARLLMQQYDAERERADVAEAEVETLRAQLDNMTVETRRVRYPDKGRLMTTDASVVIEQRLIGPWTTVEGESDE